VKAFADDPQHAFPGHGQMKPEQEEIARLKREVPYVYRWPPAPADLRRIAKAQLSIGNRLAAVPCRLLDAEARAEFSDEHCAKMRALLLSLKLEIG
jgi:hypothetical protein